MNQIMRMNKIKTNARHPGISLLFSKSKAKDLYEYWKMSVLSKAGCLTFIKTIGAAIPAYAMMALHISKKVCSGIDATPREFWWGKTEGKKQGDYWKSWDAICSPKWCGGLGLAKNKGYN